MNNNNINETEKKIVKKTKATSFILPMLGKSIYFYKPYLINCYVGDRKFCKYDHHIFVFLKVDESKEYEIIRDELKALKNFEFEYSPTWGTMMFVFSIPKDYFKDFMHFKDGKYSKFSEKLKEEVIRLNNVNRSSVIFGAFSKSEKLREAWEKDLNCSLPKDAEVLSVPNLDHEIYNN